MELLVVRHAIAEDRAEFARTGKPDEQRPLTEKGRSKMQKAAQGLAWALERLDVIATSPWLRASQTADILAEAFGGPTPIPVGALAGTGEYDALSAWVRGFGPKTRVAIVGHEPHLSGYVSMLLGGRGSLLHLKKGAAVLLRVAPSAGAGSAVLLWAASPRHLRRMGG